MTLRHKNLKYRHDIDCLRFFAVACVILFHCNIALFKGGFLGVDIFFVISGYVMYLTTYDRDHWTIFDIAEFFKKRVLRIYPVLLLCIVLTTAACALWMSTTAFDYYGKQSFFAALSISNILYAQGHNYFDPNTPILLHTWSLGVEMQFYMLFPFLMIGLGWHKKNTPHLFTYIFLTLIIFTLFWSSMTSAENKSFFLLQNRAFEFLIGMFAAQLSVQNNTFLATYKTAIYYVFLVILILCVAFFENGSSHPGIYTLAPILCTALFMYINKDHSLHESKTATTFSYLGRISYGIYLFHFPITFFTKELISDSPLILLLSNFVITIPLAALSYHYFETPIRRSGYQKTFISYIQSGAVLTCAVAIAASGYLIAKMEGMPERLKFLNPYAYEISEIHTQDKSMFTRGYNIQSSENKTVLFIGDSLLDQYIAPISSALDIPKSDIDSVTRGGCLLLKGVDFKDTFADISCSGLRDQLYALDTVYDYVIISQNWQKYKKTLLNADKKTTKDPSLTYITPFIAKTIEHFRHENTKIIILGVHSSIKYAKKLEIGPTLSKNRYQNFKNSLKTRINEQTHNRKLFKDLSTKYGVDIIHTIGIFCRTSLDCTLHDNEWSYFVDTQHLTKPGQAYAQEYFRMHLPFK